MIKMRQLIQLDGGKKPEIEKLFGERRMDLAVCKTYERRKGKGHLRDFRGKRGVGFADAVYR